MTIQIGNKVIEFDGVIDIPKENAVQLYRIKSEFDDGVTYRFNKNLLSDFGKQILYGNKEKKRMSDHIINRETLKRHCEATCEKFKDTPTSGIYGEHKLVLDLLKQTEWIPVSERLPENHNQEVLISLEWGIDIGRYDDGEWHSEWINHYDDGNVLAWMPLPKPYKAEREDD